MAMRAAQTDGSNFCGFGYWRLFLCLGPWGHAPAEPSLRPPCSHLQVTCPPSAHRAPPRPPTPPARTQLPTGAKLVEGVSADHVHAMALDPTSSHVVEAVMGVAHAVPGLVDACVQRFFRGRRVWSEVGGGGHGGRVRAALLLRQARFSWRVGGGGKGLQFDEPECRSSMGWQGG